MSCAKTAEPIEIPFGLRTWVGPRNHVLDGCPDPPSKGGILRGKKRRPVVKYSDSSVSYAKKDEPIEMPFGIWTRVGPPKHVLGGVHSGATWRIPLNRPCAAVMRPVVKLL